MDALIRRSFVVLIAAVAAAGACGGGQMQPSGAAGTSGTAGTTGSGGTGAIGTQGTWTVAVPADGLFDMRAVWGSAANDVWAVNSDGDVYHYDGAQWSLATSVGNPLYAINGSSANNVFFSGANSMVLQLGAGVLTEVPRLGGYDFTGLWVTRPNLVWTADAYNIAFWNGVDWDTLDNPTGDYYALWGLPDGQVWGANGDGSIVHIRAGTTTQEVQKPGGTSSDFYQAIWGVDANHIWAVGSQITRWTGTEWLDLGYAPGFYVYRGVWASSANNVWVVGENGLIYHGDGNDFAEFASPTTWNLNAIWGSGPNDIWAVGERGLILHYTP